MSGVRWLVVGCALAFSLASRNSRSELRKVEKGPLLSPLMQQALLMGDKTRLGAEEQTYVTIYQAI